MTRLFIQVPQAQATEKSWKSFQELREYWNGQHPDLALFPLHWNGDKPGHVWVEKENDGTCNYLLYKPMQDPLVVMQKPGVLIYDRH